MDEALKALRVDKKKKEKETKKDVVQGPVIEPYSPLKKRAAAKNSTKPPEDPTERLQEVLICQKYHAHFSADLGPRPNPANMTLEQLREEHAFCKAKVDSTNNTENFKAILMQTSSVLEKMIIVPRFGSQFEGVTSTFQARAETDEALKRDIEQTSIELSGWMSQDSKKRLLIQFLETCRLHAITVEQGKQSEQAAKAAATVSQAHLNKMERDLTELEKKSSTPIAAPGMPWKRGEVVPPPSQTPKNQTGKLFK